MWYFHNKVKWHVSICLRFYCERKTRATPISYIQKTYTIFKSTANFLKRCFLDLEEVKSACIFNQVNNNIYNIQLWTFIPIHNICRLKGEFGFVEKVRSYGYTRFKFHLFWTQYTYAYNLMHIVYFKKMH